VALAWSTVALLVLLLPGFAFLAGLTLPEQFSRESAPKNPLGQLAIIVFIALVVHGLVYALLTGCSTGASRCIRTDYVLATFQLAGADKIPLAKLAANIREYRWAILGYLLSVTILGTAGGWVTGLAIVRDKFGFRRLTSPRWALELNPDPRKQSWAFAHVVSDLEHEGTFMVYQGLLADFALGPDGRFGYLVLRQPARSTLVAKAEGWTTTAAEPIQAVPAGYGVAPGGRQFLVIEGENIKNFYFGRYEVEAGGADQVDQLLENLKPAPQGLAEFTEMYEPLPARSREPIADPEAES
jgi:hypothetical protein